MFSTSSLTMYGIKAFRLVAIYVALSVAVRIHEADYVEKVYGKGEDPPRLNSIVLNVMFMLLLVNSLVWVTLHVARLGGGVVTTEMFDYLLSETFFYTLLTLGVAYFAANIVSQKKYFSYRKDGLRAIRALKELILAVVVPVGLSPIRFSA